jgi:Ala-tRNA(Pro) deacylase
MIPAQIESYLREHQVGYELRSHFRAVAAQKLAAAEHVSGARVAKQVVVSVDGELAIAVISATQRLDLETLRRACDAERCQLVPESMFAERFWPCEPGAEPPIRLFGLPIYVDEELAREPKVLMRAGTHEDAIEVRTEEWMASERAQVVPELGMYLQ